MGNLQIFIRKNLPLCIKIFDILTIIYGIWYTIGSKIFKNYNEVFMRRIFILLSQTNTVLARSIRKCTHTEFSHSSLVMDNNFEEMYSFTRKYPKNPVIGIFAKESFDVGVYSFSKDCLSVVYTALVSDEQYEKIYEKINFFKNSKKPFKFNNLGLFACWFKVIMPRKRKRVCSQFVAEAITEAACADIKFPKHFWIMQPEDFKSTEGINLIFRGKMKDIPLGLTEEEILERIEEHKELQEQIKMAHDKKIKKH